MIRPTRHSARSTFGGVETDPIDTTDTAGAFVVGPELLEGGVSGGPLDGATFAAKEVVDVAGLPTGAGSPTRRAESPAAERHAWIVDALLAGGADLIGTTISDELAFSLSGTNVHDGTPRHPIDPGRVPGGSSAGSAAAVAHGLVDIGIGTDTGGSIRIPASYCGVIGLRPTHGVVPVAGIVPLAPSFDTVGLLARHIDTLASVWEVCLAALPPKPASLDPTELVIADDLFELLDPSPDDVASQLLAAAEAVAARRRLPVHHRSLADIVGVGLDELLGAFRALQMSEIWAHHGDWIVERDPPMGPGIRARFEMARSVTADEVDAARPIAARCRSALRALTGDGAVIAQPAASGPAPPIEQDAESKDAMRLRTLLMTAPAGLAGLPVISVPAAETGGLPVGLALVGAPEGDVSLIDLARSVEER